jgi:hypothetical protein
VSEKYTENATLPPPLFNPKDIKDEEADEGNIQMRTMTENTREDVVIKCKGRNNTT